eukprot:gene5372-6044_t
MQTTLTQAADFYSSRFDCLPGAALNGNSTDCHARGCIWQIPSKQSHSGAPSCFYPAMYGYKVQSAAVKTKKGEYSIRLERINTPMIYRNHALTLHVLIKSFKTHLQIKIYQLKKRYEVPVSLFDGLKLAPLDKDNNMYSWEYRENPFGIVIKRKTTNAVIFDTTVAPLIFADQFLQISTKLPSSNVYGFGEHEHPSYLHSVNWKSYGMFTRDQYPKPDANLYGHHPFHMALESDGNAHGVLLLNSNAMDVTLQPLPALTYRAIGGIFDFYVFFGPTPEDVVKQYTLAIGRPFMPPYWSLGFQLCRWGYNSLERVKNITEAMRKYGVPQDVLYGDIDHMDRHIDFTYNKKSYQGLPDYIRSIKKDGLRYIIILDPAISANETKPYQAYDIGVEKDIFMKNEDGTTLYGKVWPYYPNTTIGIDYDWDNQTKYYRAYTAFPDWTHVNATAYWTQVIKEHHKIIEFDGLWIDMNEPANFITGRVQGCPRNSFENPPYWPNLIAEKSPKTLAEKTTCMSAKSYRGDVQYNAHSLYGLKQSEATYDAIKATLKKRPLVLSRSTYVSNGKYAGHWLGDNLSAWEQMHKSIIGMFEFGLFGIPYIGADICGFRDDTTEDLCRRWMQLGAFYPFSRNHNSFWAKPQDPPYFGAEFARNASEVLKIRYKLLPYLYTLFYEAHTTGSTVVRPLMHEFIQDKATWSIDRQFLWGSALLISPVLDKGNTSVRAYFPKSRWYSYYTGQELKKKLTEYVQLSAPVNFIPLHVRGGFVIPTQEPANNTMFSRKKPFGLIVALNNKGKAVGSLFWDDGESDGTVKDGKYLLVKMNFDQHIFKIDVGQNGYQQPNDLHFNSLTVFGICGNRVNKITIDNVDQIAKSTYNRSSKVLNVDGMRLHIAKSHIIRIDMDMKSVKNCPYTISSSAPRLIPAMAVQVEQGDLDAARKSHRSLLGPLMDELCFDMFLFMAFLLIARKSHGLSDHLEEKVGTLNIARIAKREEDQELGPLFNGVCFDQTRWPRRIFLNYLKP